jgi:hypothetical protein
LHRTARRCGYLAAVSVTISPRMLHAALVSRFVLSKQAGFDKPTLH